MAGPLETGQRLVSLISMTLGPARAGPDARGMSKRVGESEAPRQGWPPRGSCPVTIEEGAGPRAKALCLSPCFSPALIFSSLLLTFHFSLCPACPHVCLFLFISVCPLLSVSVSISFSVPPSVSSCLCVSLCPSLSLCVCPSPGVSVCLSVVSVPASAAPSPALTVRCGTPLSGCRVPAPSRSSATRPARSRPTPRT